MTCLYVCVGLKTPNRANEVVLRLNIHLLELRPYYCSFLNVIVSQTDKTCNFPA